jgi:hypothetical protein
MFSILHTFVACLFLQVPMATKRVYSDTPSRVPPGISTVIVVSEAQLFETGSEALVEGIVSPECARWRYGDSDLLVREMPHLTLSPWTIRYHEVFRLLPHLKERPI